MFATLRRRRQLRRARPGDGSPLRDLRWWHLLTRTQFFLEPSDDQDRPERYAVDVRYLAAELEGGQLAEGSRHAPVSLYRDGVQQHIANPPVAFAVPGGVIEVATSAYGLTRMHHVPEHGSARALRPHPRSLEGLRARFGRRFPRASAVIGALAIVVLLVGLVLMIPQAAELVTRMDVVAERVGTFTSPISLPVWANTTLFVAGILAATERALTLRNHWLIDADTTWTAFG
ncbi:hypothetical protein BH708_10285 [Brachybacterium sp. P6-10-X1]|uniref:hypothetical protein n=1 Tax=Brachybacterium sp. P6-10-X1 TaxID=1903186 RepID=UPI0009718F9A|nr:hypothetical protein [Brachybacterium sp. P6-10-X1]APX33030.1 hypothetical protein BH708_10285 [Brachybacterium sp. P6-10-X1]